MKNVNHIYVYWDNSNVFHEAQRLAEERNNSSNARYRVRIHFDNLLRLAHADRPLQQALVAGSIPPEIQNLWNRLENQGIEVQLFDRGDPGRGEQEVPDSWLQQRMVMNGLQYVETPGIAVVLTGDGAGYHENRGFHQTLELLHKRRWGIEVLSWRHSCNRRMREWAERNGAFIALDDHYESITFLEPSRPGHPFSPARQASQLVMDKRPRVGGTV